MAATRFEISSPLRPGASWVLTLDAPIARTCDYFAEIYGIPSSAVQWRWAVR